MLGSLCACMYQGEEGNGSLCSAFWWLLYCIVVSVNLLRHTVAQGCCGYVVLALALCVEAGAHTT